VRGSPSALPLKLPLSVKPLPSLHEALIGALFVTINAMHDPELVPAVEWGSDRSQTAMSAKASSFSRLAGNPEQGVVGGKMAHSLRSVGSAAINYCLVAQGALDIYWYVRQRSRLHCMSIYGNREIGCWPWDVCAGIVIAEEAGGIVTGSRDAFLESTRNGTFGEVTEAILTGRKYIVVRGVAETPVSKIDISSL